jgi:succinate dehydrogenase / fumarate reductase cytochrome b subunit
MQSPLSPHLQIYSPQLTSVLSILHRLSGLGFVAAMILTTLWLYALSSGQTAYLCLCSWIEPLPVQIVLYCILASVYYHLLNGIRYLIWSMGQGYELQTVYSSGWIVVSLVFTLILLTVFWV